MQGAHEPAALGRVDGAGPCVDHSEHLAGTVDVAGAEQAADEFFELPRGGDLPVGITGTQTGRESLPAAGFEAGIGKTMLVSRFLRECPVGAMSTSGL